MAVKLKNETVWLTQKQMGEVFKCSTDNVGLHLRNIFKQGELKENSVTEDFSVTASDGKTYSIQHYNLDAIISVGYRVNSVRGTQFRIWATKILKDHIVNGFTLNNDRLKELQNSFETQKEEYMRMRHFMNKFLGTVARKDVVDVLIERFEEMTRSMKEIQKIVAKIK